MRFHAPPRAAVDGARFDHPVFAEYQRWRTWLDAADWPPLALLSEALSNACAAAGVPARQVRAQDAQLLAQARHYEQHIAGGVLPTRERNWHDLLNVLVWLRHPRLKQAMNQRQVADIDRIGPRERTRGQCALTHFDEAGVVAVFRDPRRLAAWDRHDWVGVFADLRADEVAITVVGHALLEHALVAGHFLVGKAIALQASAPAAAMPAALAALAAAIAAGAVLNDPLELRPLPLAGLPGWHALGGRREFLEQAPCFQPKRAGRVYPPAVKVAGASVPVFAVTQFEHGEAARAAG